MATTNLEHHELSKRDRILNALAVYPEDHEMSNRAIAELTQASPSYVYQLRTAITEGDLSDEEIEAASHDQLQSQYRKRITDLLGDSESQPVTTDEAPDETQEMGDGGSTTDQPSNGTVTVGEVERVRERMVQYREDAEFERKRFEGAGKNVAEEKYFIANRAIEMLDRLVES